MSRKMAGGYYGFNQGTRPLNASKNLIDLEVSNEEIRAALRAFTWFEGRVVLVLQTSLASNRKRQQKTSGMTIDEYMGQENRIRKTIGP